MYTTELENVSQICFRALDGSNHEARRHISKLLGTLVAFTQKVSIYDLRHFGKGFYKAKKVKKHNKGLWLLEFARESRVIMENWSINTKAVFLLKLSIIKLVFYFRTQVLINRFVLFNLYLTKQVIELTISLKI